MADAIKKEVIAFKAESTYRTDASPGSSDVIGVENFQTEDLGEQIDRPLVTGSYGMPQSLYRNGMKQHSWTMEVKNSGTAGTAGRIGRILQCADLKATNVVSTSDTYSTSNAAADQKWGTLYYQQAPGILHKTVGCKVTSMRFYADAGDRWLMDVTVIGHNDEEADGTISSPSYEATKGLIFQGATFATIGSYSAVIRNLEIDLGLNAPQQPDVNRADSRGQTLILSRNVTFRFTAQATLIATNDYLSQLRAGTTGTVSTGVIGSTAGNRIAYTLTNAYYRTIGFSDADGLRVYDIEGACDGSSASGGEFSLALT